MSKEIRSRTYNHMRERKTGMKPKKGGKVVGRGTEKIRYALRARNKSDESRRWQLDKNTCLLIWISSRFEYCFSTCMQERTITAIVLVIA